MAEPKREREGWMSDQYIDLFDRIDKTQDAVNAMLNDPSLDAEDAAIGSTMAGAFFTLTFIGLNIARSLERIAESLATISERE